MGKARKEGGFLKCDEFQDVEVLLEDGLLKYCFADGQKEDIVPLRYCCDDEEKLKKDIVDFLYTKNDEDVAKAADGEEFYAYVARPQEAAESVVEYNLESSSGVLPPVEEEEEEKE